MCHKAQLEAVVQFSFCQCTLNKVSPCVPQRNPTTYNKLWKALYTPTVSPRRSSHMAPQKSTPLARTHSACTVGKSPPSNSISQKQNLEHSYSTTSRVPEFPKNHQSQPHARKMYRGCLKIMAFPCRNWKHTTTWLASMKTWPYAWTLCDEWFG